MLFSRTGGRLAPVLAAALLALGLPGAAAAQETDAEPRFGIVVHGGAGTILRQNLTPEMERAYRDKLAEAIRTGHAILARGGTSLDAVEAAVRVLEDSPLFNAGKGAVFTHEGTNELDAAIMDGRTLAAGAIAGVTRVKNPITLARRVMEASPHVLLAREGAEVFAEEQGIDLVDPSYFFTQRRWDALQRALEAEKRQSMSDEAWPLAWKIGTVGAAALDRHGDLAAATSTGGMNNKRFGRVGDVPVIGAGTYASNECLAVSATGHGEFFIRNVVGYDICARMRYAGASLEEAANAVVMHRLVEQGGSGGVIAIDREGNIVMPFNSPGMYRGYASADGEVVVKIFKE